MRLRKRPSLPAFLKDLFFEPLGCPVCAMEGAGLCLACQQEVVFWGSFSHEGIRGSAMVHYHGPARQLVYNFKQKGSWEAERGLELIMDRWLKESEDGAALGPGQWDIIVPVPSGPARRKKRGFDPAAVLGRHLSRCTGIPLVRALENSGQTEHKTMDRRDRRTAALDSFQLRASQRSAICHKRVLIFDDIMTTGNTLSAAAALLREADALEIGFLVLERATR